MFRRKRSGPAPAQAPAAPAVAFDRWAGDPELPAVAAALARGETGPFETLMASSDHHRREHALDVLVEGLDRLPVLDQWVADNPDSPLPLLLRGAQGIGWAWAARTGKRAHLVEKDAWAVFHGRLRDAEADLTRAARLDRADPLPWGRLVISGRGLEITQDERRVRYDEGERRFPGLAFAADQYLQDVCQKWSGSHEAMFAFARTTATGAQPGDPRHRLVGIAHFERAIECEDVEAKNQYRRNPAVQEELIAAAEASALRPGYGATPQERITMNAFAYLLGYFNRADAARPLFEAIGDRPTRHPWSWMAADPPRAFTSLRTQALSA
jgi:hypothetical protein